MKLNFFQKLRLKAIEATLRWKGEIYRGDIESLFGVGNQKAALDFALYNKLYPGQMKYDYTLRRYLPSESFKGYLTSDTSEDFLDMLKGEGESACIAGPYPAVEIIGKSTRIVRSSTINLINRAIVHKKKIKVTYQSLSTPIPQTYSLSPHSLVYNGYRWHIRAYSDHHEGYRDFLPIRMSDIQLESIDQACLIDQDDLWCNFVELRFMAHESLSAEQKQVLNIEYEMKDGIWTVKVRAALVHYFIEFLGIDSVTGYQNRDRRLTIFLSNIDDIKKYLIA